MKPWLNWASLPKTFDWMANQPDLQLDVTVASVLGHRYTIGVAQLCLWEPGVKPQWSFARLLIWTKAYLIQKTRPRAWPTRSPVVPLVCGRPLACMKLPCLDGPRCHWMTGHVYGVGRTMIHLPWYFATSATIATTRIVPLSPAAWDCMTWAMVFWDL